MGESLLMKGSNLTELYQQARQLLKERKVTEAVEIYQRIIGTKPTEKKAHTGLATVFFQLKKIPGSDRALQNSLQAFPGRCLSLHQHGSHL
ncbi:MAG: hypothetical protein CME32_21985 [Gimesia sp.]|nr:hypothetical protein [Gimesia sp.]